MAWRGKHYPTSEAAYAAHPGGIPIGTTYRGADGRLYLVTPGGIANLGAHDISGEDGAITVSPSILVSNAEGPQYHGYFENGILKDDCDGRIFSQWPATA